MIFNSSIGLHTINLHLFSLLHANLASINKHVDDLVYTISQIKTEFDVIGITEHKIQNGNSTPISNVDITGYHPFIFDPTSTTHGGTGFYVKSSRVFNKRDDLKFNSPGNFESTFIELVFPDDRNMIVGCIYRHPTSEVTINQFNQDYIEPMLDQIISEDKVCAIMGDFKIDLLKSERNDDANTFFNNFTSSFFYTIHTSAD